MFWGDEAHGETVEFMVMCPLLHFLFYHVGPLDQGNVLCDTMSVEQAFINPGWQCCWRHCGDKRQTLTQADVTSGKTKCSSSRVAGGISVIP